MMKNIQKPFTPLFILNFDDYRHYNIDLAHLTNEELSEHWKEFGEREGRTASRYQLREHFVKYIQRFPTVLEIGPFFNPTIEGQNVFYFDVLSREDLIKRALSIGINDRIDKIPFINWVSNVGDLSIINRKFNSVISSHCIEHQPDLIKHINLVSSLLEDEGEFCLLIPDKRFCFDHFLAPSSTDAVLEARGRELHSFRSVFEHRAFTTHNDPVRHWGNDHGELEFITSISTRAAAVEHEFKKANGTYIDVHAWQFTPRSFQRVILDLYNEGYITLKPKQVYPTPAGRQEFSAILIKG